MPVVDSLANMIYYRLRSVLPGGTFARLVPIALTATALGCSMPASDSNEPSEADIDAKSAIVEATESSSAPLSRLLCVIEKGEFYCCRVDWRGAIAETFVCGTVNRSGQRARRLVRLGLDPHRAHRVAGGPTSAAV